MLFSRDFCQKLWNGNYGNFFSQSFWGKIRESVILTEKLINSWFHEIFFRNSEFFVFIPLWKNYFSSIQLKDFFCNNVAFTKFLTKKRKSEFYNSHCDTLTLKLQVFYPVTCWKEIYSLMNCTKTHFTKYVYS